MGEEISIANLPGQRRDLSARQVRRELLADTRSPRDIAAEAPYRREDGTIDKELLDTELYALSSFVIEQEWAHMSAALPQEGIPVVAGTERMNAYQTYTTSMFEFLKEKRSEFQKAANVRMTAEGYELTRDDAFLTRYVEGIQVREGAIGLPSMKDLVVLIQKFGEVTPKIFERALGREPSVAEVMRTVRHPSVQSFFLEIMTNSRSFTYPLFARLEGSVDARPKMDQDITVGFDPKYFVMRADSDGNPIVQVNEQFLSYYRKVIEEVAQNMTEAGTTPLRALQCPVLYTKLFKEMFDWNSDELERFLLRQGVRP